MLVVEYKATEGEVKSGSGSGSRSRSEIDVEVDVDVVMLTCGRYKLLRLEF